jgi:hypothetical protein
VVGGDVDGDPAGDVDGDPAGEVDGDPAGDLDCDLDRDSPAGGDPATTTSTMSPTNATATAAPVPAMSVMRRGFMLGRTGSRVASYRPSTGCPS